jgi:hypothetical protein
MVVCLLYWGNGPCISYVPVDGAILLVLWWVSGLELTMAAIIPSYTAQESNDGVPIEGVLAEQA